MMAVEMRVVDVSLGPRKGCRELELGMGSGGGAEELEAQALDS